MQQDIHKNSSFRPFHQPVGSSEVNKEAQNGALGLTSSVHLPFDRLHASRLLDDIIDELGDIFIPHLICTDPSLGQQLRQVGVKVVGIPADMSNVPDGDAGARFYEYCKTTSRY